MYRICTVQEGSNNQMSTKRNAEHVVFIANIHHNECTEQCTCSTLIVLQIVLALMVNVVVGRKEFKHCIH